MCAAVLGMALLAVLNQGVVAVSAELYTPDSSKGPVSLTRNAKRTDFVVLAQAVATNTMTGFCDSSSSDWRGWMPIYLARALGPSRPLIVTDQLPLKGRPGRCRMCYTGDKAERNTYFSCDEWFFFRESSHTKFVIIVGTGPAATGNDPNHSEPENFPNVLDILDAPWVNSQKTTVWHFPITRIHSVDENKVFPKVHRNFHVMRDRDWVKPVQHEGPLSQDIDWCAAQQPKRNVLLYVARYHGWKGQMDFLLHADPKLLQGYKIVFFTSSNVTPNKGTTHVEKLEVVAKKRRIDAEFHYKRMSKEAVAQVSCRAKGLLHFARIDANPRAVSEAIINGLQVFVSKQANVPAEILSQPFVKVTSNPNHGVPTSLNKDLKEFMGMLDNPRKRASLVSFAKERLDPAKAYHELCQKLGICARPAQQLR
mmetsp:Transcript_39930/g.100391  ORF Transcript_39930/g.100391 Transcript_39930/m.100391 type:complete len:424 (-) Transcript_39930:78-1349(-)